MRKVGEYYNPVDGFVSHPGIAGYALYMRQDLGFRRQRQARSRSASPVSWIAIRGRRMGQAQSDNSLLLDVLTKSALDLQLFTGSNYWRFGDVLTPISQNAGFQFTYTADCRPTIPGNFPYHGTSSYPTTINYNTGHYGTGRLDTWFRSTTIRVGNRGALTLALDDTAQWIPAPGRRQRSVVRELELRVSNRAKLVVCHRVAPGRRQRRPIPTAAATASARCSNVSRRLSPAAAHAAKSISRTAIRTR